MTPSRKLLKGLLIMLAANSTFAAQPAATKPNEDVGLVTRGNNSFALQLYQSLRTREGNLFFSPYSISAATVMAYAGAVGETQQQMANVLCLPTSAESLQKLGVTRPPLTQDQFARVFGGIIKNLNARAAGGKYELRVANALWGQKDYRFLPAFTRLVEQQYGGKLQQVDYISAADAARQTINAWIEGQTNGRIKDLIGPGVLNTMTRLVLTNAIYFKGEWAKPFEKSLTRSMTFVFVSGRPVRVPMMQQQTVCGYGETDKLQLLELPYAGKELSLVILLPKDHRAMAALEESLTPENVTKWLDEMREQEVSMYVPKFTTTSRLTLAQTLQAMGITNAFSPARADFSAMTGKREFFISEVIHQAYVEVNEEGTEASAATAIVVETSGTVFVPRDPIPVFRADHPFVFLIRDKISGSILFLGRMMDPRT
jgi:serpin B